MDAFVMDLELLPYPAQDCVIKNLEQTDDILNLLQVFPGGELESVATATRGEWMFQKVFPFLVPYLSLEDALKCRQVCRRWKKTVDNTMENVGLTEPDYSQTLTTIDKATYGGGWSKHPFLVRYPWNGNEEPMLRFVREMESHPGNPFPFRSVSFGIFGLDNHAFWENVKQFLEKFGHHVWKLSLSIHLAGHQSTLLVRELLQWTSNVRRIHLELNNFNVPQLPAQEKREMEQRLRQSGFPALPDLTHVQCMVAPPFYKLALPQYSEQLVQLHVINGRDDAFLKAYNREEHGSFPNLKLLQVWVENRRQLRKLTQLNSPLQNLEIICAYRIPLSRHLDVCRHFASTLECLTIDFDVQWGNDTRKRIAYNYSDGFSGWQFPKLVTLSFNNPNPVESFDILPAIQPGLKTLHILSDDLEDPDLLFEEMAGEKIKIHGFLDKMYESAVWEKLPRLETVKVEMLDQNDDLIEGMYTRAQLPENKSSERMNSN